MSRSPAYDKVELSLVLDRVKQEVGAYNYDDQQTVADWTNYLNRLGAQNGCPKDVPLRFYITKIKMTFNIVRDISTSITGQAKVPLPFVLSAIGPSASASYEGTDSQSLTTYYYPGADAVYYDPNFDRSQAIILNNLDALRDATVLAGKQLPCFEPDDAPSGPNDPVVVNKSGDQKSLVFGVSVVKTGGGGLGVTFVPAALSLTASGTYKSTTGNTIEVDFVTLNGNGNPRARTAPAPRKANS